MYEGYESNAGRAFTQALSQVDPNCAPESRSGQTVKVLPNAHLCA